MTRYDRRPWSNWLGNVVIEHPERHYYPETLDDLLDIVTTAEQQTPPRRIRASGSHLALSDAAASPDWLVETSALTETITSVIPKALSRQALDERARNGPGTGHCFTYYHVQAGITIADLSLRLDAGPGQRWALPTMGGEASQTLAGAISTGTHGSDHQMPPMADFVHAIHLVTGGGRQLWIERDTGITDPDLLAAALPGVRQERSTTMFNAALIAVGRMGIIYSLVIRVVEQFSLDQIIVKSTWEEQRAQLLAPFPIFSQPPPDIGSHLPQAQQTRFVGVVMSPYARNDGRRTCYVTLRWAGPDGPRLASRASPLMLILRYRTLQPAVLALLGGDLALLLLTVLATGEAKPLVKAELVVLIALALLVPPSGRTTVGDLLAAACNTANRHGQPQLVRWLIERVLQQVSPLRRVRDVGYRIMDLGLTRIGGYRSDAVEVAFDAIAGDHIRFVQEDLFPTLDRAAARGITVPGYIALRFTRRSAALLAMQRWDLTCSIEMGVLNGIEGGEQILEALQAAAIRRGGTVHWGERNTLARAAVEQAFPRLRQWQAELARTGLQDGDTFDNAFCQAHGLEPQRSDE